MLLRPTVTGCRRLPWPSPASRSVCSPSLVNNRTRFIRKVAGRTAQDLLADQALINHAQATYDALLDCRFEIYNIALTISDTGLTFLHCTLSLIGKLEVFVSVFRDV